MIRLNFIRFNNSNKTLKDMSKIIINADYFYRVYMRCVTWGRDSHGLFDYESR